VDQIAAVWEPGIWKEDGKSALARSLGVEFHHKRHLSDYRLRGFADSQPAKGGQQVGALANNSIQALWI
jgi:hypothetical protein